LNLSKVSKKIKKASDRRGHFVEFIKDVWFPKKAATDEQQCVRHEVSYVIVLLVNNETRPAIPLAVPYVVTRDGNVLSWKPTDNVPTVAITGIYTARWKCIP
jgi:hypothetical protein